MRNIIKSALIIGSLTSSMIVMADAPKKPDVTKPADKAAGSGDAKAADKTPAKDAKATDKTPAKDAKATDKTPAKAPATK